MSIEKPGYSPESEVKKDKFETPQVYKMIESNAPTEQLAQEIYSEFYKSDHSSERLYLGIQELLDRGNEGVSALASLGKGTDELGKLAAKVSEDPEISGYELEELLGMRRWDKVGNDLRFSPNNKAFNDAVDHAKDKGYIPEDMPPEVCLTPYHMAQRFGLSPHMHETIDQDIFSTSSTFSVAEPTYIEMSGPKEILRLREIQNPKMLLLGTYGKYSAREFSEYTDKINPNITPIVIDNDPDSLDAVMWDEDNNSEKILVNADALKLSFADNSFDHLYSNYLVRFLYYDRKNRGKEPLIDFMKEAYRVLKPGGSLMAVEAQFGIHENFNNLPSARNHFKEVALDAGFEISPGKPFYFDNILRAEVGSAKISENGFGDYRGTFLTDNDAEETLCFRLIKPA